MKKLTSEQFDELIAASPQVSTRIKRELRFVTSVANMSDERWDESEFVAITDRTGMRGVLLVQPDEMVYVLPYELKQGLTSSTGRAQAIICDLCRTWQVGTRSGSITFTKGRRTSKSVSYLCCGDLLCSRHVRNQTSASKTSRSQLREDLTTEQRINRLRERLRLIVAEVGAPGITL